MASEGVASHGADLEGVRWRVPPLVGDLLAWRRYLRGLRAYAAAPKISMQAAEAGVMPSRASEWPV
ncbi:hypothetical protein GCM10023259_041810 [Thermocatellispora tengchongensis]